MQGKSIDNEGDECPDLFGVPGPVVAPRDVGPEGTDNDAEGDSRGKSFLIGTLSGVVEPVGSVAILLLAGVLGVALPYLLAFAAGAMMYVVVEELIPETAQGRHTNLSTIGFAVGFVLMMVMDVLLG
ncbi:MAG: hypothetical protein J5677_01560 [Bacteroidales bacterium]|nr:hypothetical protein [Bacteroidales bacterium]